MIAGVGLVAGPTLAGAQVLTFEGITTGVASVPIGNYYNGSGGPNYGITFSDNATTLCLNTATRSCSNTSRGGRGDPASQGYAMFFQQGANAYMNRAAGFTNGFSFFYSDVAGTGGFNVYSGLNGTGTLLASLILPQTAIGPEPCYSAQFCPFIAAGVSFTGMAESVVFTGTNALVLDDVTFGSATAGMATTAPEPGTWALVAGGLAGLGVVARRRRS